MHQLFRLVLGQKDLSRAGDLFSLDDSEIEDSLTEALEQIKIISSSSNYNRPPVMALAIPIAVRFLHRGSRELRRSLSNYLCLAAIAKAELLAEHTEVIVRSILQGNTMLLRVLPAVCEEQPQPIHRHLTGLLALMPQLEQPEQYHLLRLLHVAARRRQVEVVQKCVPFLIRHLKDATHNDVILNILTEISGYEPAALDSFLPRLKEIGERFPGLIGQLARIYGAVGLVDEERARSCLLYLVSQLASTEHSSHHVLLLEIRRITEAFSGILGPQSRDIFRMSNSFTTIAGLLSQQLETSRARSGRKTSTENGFPEKPGEAKLLGPGNEDQDKLQVKIQAFEDKKLAEGSAPGSIRRHSLGQVSKEERKNIRFNRSKSLAFHTALTRGVSSDDGEGEEPAGIPGSLSLSEIAPFSQGSDRLPLKMDTVGSQPRNSSASHPSILHIAPEDLPEMVKEDFQEETSETTRSPVEYQDKLYLHLKENLGKVKAYATEIARKIPVPDQCTIEDTVRSCVAKLFFTCSLKGHYCLYSKSSFILISQEPQPWIQIMLLFQQSLFPEPLSIQSRSVQFLRALWEKTQAGATHSFETAMTESTFPQQKDLDQVQLHLEEVRFFDVFGFSEAAGAWQCFMCNNPERASVINQDGQPLIEGKLKEKQVRWKFIKRWKTRYFTLAGNQLLFQKGKSKDDPEDAPLELSKVQSVKAVAKKRRDRSLPRAFEIFTDNKTYVFKAKDEKNAEEWLQCLSVAVAQAKERENREVTTYL
ncbi:ventricular zone-expressed PH domain-containing protein homolog 1 isoform X5 [Ictidomys tridecemlineatus]